MSVSEEESLYASRDLDPLLKDLSEKQQSFRRNVVSLAADLKDVRCRLVSQERSCARELTNRQAVERKAKSMEAEIFQLQKSLEERNGQLQSSASTTKQFLKELDDIRSQLYGTQATADASAASAQSAQLHCLELAKEFDEKKSILNEHENHMNRLTEQLNNLQMDLQARETLQKQLKDEVLRIEKDIMQALTRATASKDCELRKILDEVAPKNLEKISNLIVLMDEEIAKLRDEIGVLSAHWKFKAKEIEFQLAKNRKVDQELKKRVLKLEFCLQETRTQTRKLQRMGEMRDKALKEIRELLATKQPGTATTVDKQNFWESPNFKIAVSMSMLILVVFAKR